MLVVRCLCWSRLQPNHMPNPLLLIGRAEHRLVFRISSADTVYGGSYERSCENPNRIKIGVWQLSAMNSGSCGHFVQIREAWNDTLVRSDTQNPPLSIWTLTADTNRLGFGVKDVSGWITCKDAKYTWRTHTHTLMQPLESFKRFETLVLRLQTCCNIYIYYLSGNN